MTKETINVGIRANDGKGDTVRAAFIKTNNNFSELYTTVSNNANIGNSQFEQTITLAQGAFDKVNTIFLGNISFEDNLIYSNNSIQIGIDPSEKKSWASLFGQITTQNNSTYASSVAYDNDGAILVAMTTVNENNGLPQSTLVKFDEQGNIFWRKTVPTINSKPSFGESVDVDANNNVYLLTNIPGEFSTLVTKFDYLGQNVWSSLIADAEYSDSICVDDQGFCYFTGGHNLLTGLDNTGELLFTFYSPQATNGRSCIVVDGGILVGSSNGFVHKFDTEGVYLWSNKVDGSADMDCLAFDGSDYYAATKDGNFIYKVASNNQIIWERTITGVSNTNIHWMKYDNGYLYINGSTIDPNIKNASITYKVDSNGSLVWAKSLEVIGANNQFSLGNKQIDVKDDHFMIVGHCNPSSNVELALLAHLPTDGSLASSYAGSNGSSWGPFTYVNVPEANTIFASGEGTGNAVITITTNTDYSYTMENLVYGSIGAVYENQITNFIQEWKYNTDGSVILPGSGVKKGIDMSDKDITNVANISFVNGSTQTKAFTMGRSIPSSSVGISGDKVGDIAANSSYLYYCVETHTGNANNIWKRVSWSNDTW